MSADVALLSALIFISAISASFIFLAVLQILFIDKKSLTMRLIEIESKAKLKNKRPMATSPRYLELLSLLSKNMAKINFFKKIVSYFDASLTAADIPLSSEEYVFLTALGSVSGGIIASISGGLFFGILVFLATVLFSMIWLKSAKTRRMSKFNLQIGDVLVVMANSMRAGYSFLQSMDLIRKELPPPISIEFNRAFQEMTLGISTEEALHNLNCRLKSDDLDLVITAVLIQRQVGGNLAEILDNIANTIRERVRIKGEIKTLTAQGKISGIIIGILPILLAAALFLISPEYLLLLLTDSMGRTMLISAIIMEIAGIIIIRKIIDIKV
jgi:tight adherence protein B